MGERLADFVQFLNSSGVPAGSLHVIGFSLGAEAAGFAGKILNRRGLRLGRITGKIRMHKLLLLFIVLTINILLHNYHKILSQL